MPDDEINRSVRPLSPAEPVPDEFDLLCEGCGYSLIGLMVNRCPECGREYDPAELPLARVPWLYRVRLGRVDAYVKTVFAILRHPHAFAKELSRPVRVSATDAFAFRRMTIRIVWWAIVVAGVLAMTGIIGVNLRWWIVMRLNGNVTLKDCAACVLMTSAILLGSWLFLWLATDMPTFIWKGLPGGEQNLAPVHHYACAPLVLMPLAVLMGIGVIFGAWANWRGEWHWLALLLSVLPTAFLALMMWRTALIFMRVATGCGLGRQLLLAIYLPVHWLLMAALGLGCVILAAIFLAWLN